MIASHNFGPVEREGVSTEVRGSGGALYRCVAVFFFVSSVSSSLVSFFSLLTWQ